MSLFIHSSARLNILSASISEHLLRAAQCWRHANITTALPSGTHGTPDRQGIGNYQEEGDVTGAGGREGEGTWNPVWGVRRGALEEPAGRVGGKRPAGKTVENPE